MKNYNKIICKNNKISKNKTHKIMVNNKIIYTNNKNQIYYKVLIVSKINKLIIKK